MLYFLLCGRNYTLDTLYVLGDEFLINYVLDKLCFYENLCQCLCILCILKEHIQGTIASKINVTPKGIYMPISKLHSILAIVNLLAHNSISRICYCGQIS